MDTVQSERCDLVPRSGRVIDHPHVYRYASGRFGLDAVAVIPPQQILADAA
jgi:hypothetical protein